MNEKVSQHFRHFGQENAVTATMVRWKIKWEKIQNSRVMVDSDGNYSATRAEKKGSKNHLKSH